MCTHGSLPGPWPVYAICHVSLQWSLSKCSVIVEGSIAASTFLAAVLVAQALSVLNAIRAGA